MFKIIGATVVYGFACFGFYKWWEEYMGEQPASNGGDKAEQGPRPRS